GDGAAPPLRIDAPARALAFAPDGQRLAIGAADGAVRIVSVADGATLQRFAAHPGGVTAIAFGTGGDTVATGSAHGEVALWQAATGQALLRAAFARTVVGLDFNRDGSSALAKWSLAATDAAGTVHLIDVDPDRWHRPVQPPSTLTLDAAGAAPGVAARFTASGRCLARAAADGSVAVVTVFDGQRLLTLAPGTAASAPTVALATAQTRRFASLDAAGRIAAYEQPLCGDAEAVCAFARGRLARGPAPEQWRRWIPKGFDLKADVRQPPVKGGACEALINKVLTPP
ncbi:MAG TPA: hypothetical protein VNU71_19285, partial [Burkholderiaceae bacterium]|nr:hypothetical protein [Burkholderiaceae bacterium]